MLCRTTETASDESFSILFLCGALQSLVAKTQLSRFDNCFRDGLANRIAVTKVLILCHIYRY